MVGKIRHVRQRIHQEAVKLTHRPGSPTQAPRPACAAAPEEPPGPGSRAAISDRELDEKRTQSPVTSGIFAGTHISPEALVQTLTLEPLPDVPTPAKKGPDEKKVKSKKEKMKERRERWLNKISSIKQAKEQQAAEARRQATPVVGDMRPLADALPELSQLIAPPAAATAPTTRRKSRKNKAPVKRPEPTDFSQMKQSQKRKLLDAESQHFAAAVKTLSAKMNPLADIGEQLRKRMRQEDERNPS